MLRGSPCCFFSKIILLSRNIYLLSQSLTEAILTIQLYSYILISIFDIRYTYFNLICSYNIQFNSQMQSQNQYHYDFSYSINFDNIPLQIQTSSDLQHSLRQWCDIFFMMNIFKEEDIGKSTSILFRLPHFRKLGAQLLDLCLVMHSDMGLQQKQSKAEKLRQQNYQSLKQLQRLNGKEKNRNNDIITLCLYAIIQKVIQENIDNDVISSIYKNINSSSFDDDFVVFHMLCWEIKGQLISKQNMEGLITKYFEFNRFNMFMHKSLEEITKMMKPRIEQPLTFRASIINKQQKMGAGGKILYQSFKQISLRNQKQNSMGNQHQQVSINNEQQSMEYDNGKNSFLTFRKKLNFESGPRVAPKIMFKKDENMLLNQQGRHPNTQLFGFRKIKTIPQSANQNMSFSTLRENQQEKKFAENGRRW